MTLFARARAERAAAPEPARNPLGGSTDVLGGRGAPVSAERAAAPEPACATPTAGGSTYSSNRGLT